MDQVNQLYDQANELYRQGNQLINQAKNLVEVFHKLLMALILLIYLTSPIAALVMAADLTLLGGITLTIIGLLSLTGIILIAKQAQQVEGQANQLYEQADRLLYCIALLLRTYDTIITFGHTSSYSGALFNGGRGSV